MPIHDGLEHSPGDDALRRRVISMGTNASTLAEVSRTIAAAFVLHRRVVSKETKKRLKEVEHVNPVSVDEAVTAVLKLYIPSWIATLTPALVAGYYLGLREAEDDSLSEVWIRETAAAYAVALAEHLNDVSRQAALEGFQAQVNRRVAARAAAERVIDAFGVAPRTMKTLVNIWTKAPDPAATVLTSRVQNSPIANRVDTLVAAALTKRADQIGQTESQSAKNQAKQLTWLWGLQTGDIPAVARKVWITAEDERVCPQCGPLDGKDSPIDEQFKVPGGGKVWGPALHPDCRCELKLEKNPAELKNVLIELTAISKSFTPERSAFGVVHKARGDDPYNRNADGQFARRESRPARQYREATREEVEQAEQVQALLNNVAPEQSGPTPLDLKGPTLTPLNLSRDNPIKRTALNLTPLDLTSQSSLPQSSLPQSALPQSRLPDSPKSSLADIFAAARQQSTLPKNQRFSQWMRSEQPLFALVTDQPANQQNPEDIMLIDEFVKFYPRADAPRGRPDSLKGELDKYWRDVQRDELSTEFRSLPGYDSDTDQVEIEVATGSYYITFDDFQTAFNETLYGRPLMASTTLSVIYQEYPEPRSSLRALNDDEEGIWSAPEEDFIPARDLADYIGIPDIIDRLTPTVVVADRVNIDQDSENFNDPTAVLSNPGKWRITGYGEGMSSVFEHELPHRVRAIDPDDLFENPQNYR